MNTFKEALCSNTRATEPEKTTLPHTKNELKKEKTFKKSDRRPKMVKNAREAIFYRQQSISEIFPLVSGL